MTPASTTLSERLNDVEERIHRAAARAGRRRDDITLVAVSKVFPAEALREAFHLGIRHFGENYVQEFQGKAPQLAGLPGVSFHLIGHLQSNKAKIAAELFHVIQTVDTPRLALRLDDLRDRPLPVMIEVKLSSEESKRGCDPAALPALVDTIRATRHLQLTGLMTMPPWSDDPELSRPYFRQLRTLATGHNLPHLSMGMSHDLEAAIEEGATHVRVGTALFGPRRRA